MGRKNNINLKEKRLLLDEKGIDITHYDRILDKILHSYEREILTKNELTMNDYNFLLKSSFYDIKIDLCFKHNLPEEILIKLINDKSENIRGAVALSAYKLPYQIINKLSKDKKLKIRKIIALSPNTPKEIFLEIKGTYSDLIQREDCPSEVFLELINIKKFQIDIAKHNNLKSKEVIDKLLSLSDYEVDKILIQNQNISIETKMQIAHRLSISINHQDRRFIAKYSFIPQELLYKLSKDEHWLVRQHVLMNKNVSKSIINKLLNDKDHIVRRDAKKLLTKGNQCLDS